MAHRAFGTVAALDELCARDRAGLQPLVLPAAPGPVAFQAFARLRKR